MNIEQIPIYDIKSYENNAKKHTDKAKRTLCNVGAFMG